MVDHVRHYESFVTGMLFFLNHCTVGNSYETVNVSSGTTIH